MSFVFSSFQSPVLCTEFVVSCPLSCVHKLLCFVSSVFCHLSCFHSLMSHVICFVFWVAYLPVVSSVCSPVPKSLVSCPMSCVHSLLSSVLSPQSHILCTLSHIFFSQFYFLSPPVLSPQVLCLVFSVYCPLSWVHSLLSSVHCPQSPALLLILLSFDFCLLSLGAVHIWHQPPKGEGGICKFLIFSGQGKKGGSAYSDLYD